MDVHDWLHPSVRAMICGVELECYDRLDLDRHGGMVLLRSPSVGEDEVLDATWSADLDDLAWLEAQGLVYPAGRGGDDPSCTPPSNPAPACPAAAMAASLMSAA